MKHTKEEIINALNVIKDECTGTICQACPFCYDTPNTKSKCALQHSNPCEWKIEELPPQTWRALK